jgi:hypothetical protein
MIQCHLSGPPELENTTISLPEVPRVGQIVGLKSSSYPPAVMIYVRVTRIIFVANENSVLLDVDYDNRY